MKLRSLLTALAALVLAFVAQPAFAATVTIAWNPSAEADVAGYIVKYGTKPGEYGAQVNVGKVTTFKANDLVVGQTYYFTVQAYAADGSTSAPAAELPAIVIGASRGVASRLLSPQRDAEDVTSAQIFSWEQVANAAAYDFSIGTQPGGRDVVDSGETKRTWWVADSLPAGVRLFARLRTRVGERWTANRPLVRLRTNRAPDLPVRRRRRHQRQRAVRVERRHRCAGVPPDGRHDARRQ